MIWRKKLLRIELRRLGLKFLQCSPRLDNGNSLAAPTLSMWRLKRGVKDADGCVFGLQKSQRVAADRHLFRHGAELKRQAYAFDSFAANPHILQNFGLETGQLCLYRVQTRRQIRNAVKPAVIRHDFARLSRLQIRDRDLHSLLVIQNADVKDY